MANMDAKQLRIIIVLLVAVALFVAIRFGYTPIIEKADAVSVENRELESELSLLQTFAKNEEELAGNVDKAKAELDIIKRKYPAKVTPEKSIKFARDMEVFTGTSVKTMSFNEAENIYISTIVNENGENIMGYVSPVNISYEASYEGLKGIVNYINGFGERMNVKELTASYNQETGLLTGTMVINRYFVSGFGKEYEAPVINNIKISTDNIFGAVK